jgi:TetR/AcrR family transcriptional regulator, transcriptional repressor for nem operon
MALTRLIDGARGWCLSYIAGAMTLHGVTGDWTAKSLAFHTQAVLQGAFILAKARGGPAIAAESIDHLKRYIRLLFGRPQPGEGT